MWTLDIFRAERGTENTAFRGRKSGFQNPTLAEWLWTSYRTHSRWNRFHDRVVQWMREDDLPDAVNMHLAPGRRSGKGTFNTPPSGPQVTWTQSTAYNWEKAFASERKRALNSASSLGRKDEP